MSSSASFGRVRTVLLLVGIVCAGCVWSTNAVNPLQKVKDVFSRRAMKKNKTNNSNHGDLESQAEEILSYNSACDQQLAKAMVILGEQKKAAESALDVCKQHREVARDDIRRLENQVAVADDRVQEKEHEYTEQLQTLRKVTDAQLAEAKFQLTQKDEEMEKRLEDNANQLKTLEAAKNREIEEIRQNHSLEIQRLEQDHENNIVHLKETIESLRQENREDREKAEENLSSIKTESEMHVEKLHNEWSSKLATAESTAKETLEKVKTEADQNIASLSDKLTTCSKELKDNRAAKKKLQAQYDHALQVSECHKFVDG